MIKEATLNAMRGEDLDEIGLFLGTQRIRKESDYTYRFRVLKSLKSFKLKYGDKIGIS